MEPLLILKIKLNFIKIKKNHLIKLIIDQQHFKNYPMSKYNKFNKILRIINLPQLSL